MKTVNKQFKYRGYEFNIKVEFETKIEKRLDGKRWHTVICNCLGADNYYVKKQVLDQDLEQYLTTCEPDAEKYVDDKLNLHSPPNRLAHLGFS